MATAKIKVNSIPLPVPNPPDISYNDKTDRLSASSPLGNSEIAVSENGAAFTDYAGQITVGNVDRPAGYWQFKIKAATNRAESAIAISPAFYATFGQSIQSITLVNATNATDIQTISTGNTIDLAALPSRILNVRADVTGTVGSVVFNLSGTQSRSQTETAAPYTLFGDGGGVYNPWTPAVGSYTLVVTPYAGAGGTGLAGASATFNFSVADSGVSTTPVAPTIIADDVANTLSANHPLGNSEILINTNNAGFVQYDGSVISVGDVARAAGYWQFKIKAASGRNESPIAMSPAFTVAVASTPNAYTLTSAASVSAGVYNLDGTLARTLFSGKKQNAGTYPIVWDGADDFQRPLPFQGYNIRVLTNNVQYIPEGTIGNTSTDKIGPTIHNSLEPVGDIVIVGNTAYYTVNYNEQNAAMYAFSLSTPQIRMNLWQDYGNQVTEHCCTDGTNIYWTGWDAYQPTDSWIYATKVLDNSLVSFSGGQTYQVKYGRFYASVLDHRTTTAKATGIAASASYIFISYSAMGIVTVLNKATGAKVRDINLTTPTRMTVDGSSIWIATGSNTLQKYAINSDGSIGTGGTPISGLASIVDVKLNGTTLAVIDGGANQQVKFFNNSSGAAIGSPFGQQGGNYTSPVVANDRFAFWMIDENTKVKNNRGGIAFASDGSFWIADGGNRRIMHYDTSRNYIESIVYQGKTYGCFVDANNHSRLTSNFQEFSVVYNQPNIKASWTYKYNWEGQFPQGGYGWFGGIKCITTLSNGRTYGYLGRDAGGIEIVELDATNGLRFTGVVPTIYNYARFLPNGDIYAIDGTGFGENEVWKRQRLTGFTSSFNPIYAAVETVLTVFTTADMLNANLSGAHVHPWEVTSSNVLVCHRGNAEKDSNNIIKEPIGSYHLAGRNATTGALLFQTLRATHKEYDGDYPLDAFDVGNGIQPNGTHPMEYFGNVGIAVDRSIITGFNGEGWKGGNETNKWNHYYDNGLFIGQFGTTGYDLKGDLYANYTFAGNAFSPALVKEGNDYFLTHNDENAHGGVFRWRITGLDSIQEQVVPISSSFTRTTENVRAGVDLMSQLPFNTMLPASVNGWTRSVFPDTGGFTARTNALTYDKRKPFDIFIHYTETANRNILRALGNNTGASAWSLSGRICYNNSMPNFMDSAGLNQYIEILDNNGKIIVRLHEIINFSVTPNSASLLLNNTVLLTGNSGLIRYTTAQLKNIFISVSGTSISASYNDATPISVAAPFEAGAIIANPTTLRLSFVSNAGPNYEKYMGISDFLFNSTLP